MGFRFACARALGAVSTWVLQRIFHRPAGNFPGKIGLAVDPLLIEHLRPRIQKGSVVVVGTNGKTTVTNMIADCLETSGRSVACNRLGANLAYGVATTLMQSPSEEWAVIESDELWLAKTLPQMQANYVVLLNLFRDQLDRCGEIDRVQNTIIDALKASPSSVLIFNADDPQCAAIAAKAGNPSIAFGIDEDMGLAQNTVSDAQMCQMCEGMFDYEYRQYGQLGTYCCRECGFSRPALDVRVTDVVLGEDGSSFLMQGLRDPWSVEMPFGGAYMIYNVGLVAAFAQAAGIELGTFQKCVSSFQPNNGRLQSLSVGGRQVLLNLAKNPTGFNQNLKLVTQGEGPRIVGFFINDKEADGHDVSWLWDIDFEELAACDQLLVFAGGIRGHDMQVRLKYAGVKAQVVSSAKDLFEKVSSVSADAKVYLIANYTALPEVKRDVEQLSRTMDESAVKSPCQLLQSARIESPKPVEESPLVIAHLFPDLLNLYGDGGNVTVLQRRMEWRGLPVEVRTVNHGQSIDLSDADLVFLGGGPDREQRLASQDLAAMTDQLKDFVNDGGALLAICGGYQILGSTWLLGEEDVPGLGLIDLHTGRAQGGSTNRLIENVALKVDGIEAPVVGYENHAGRTYLGSDVKPFGKVVSRTGHGNNDDDGADGVMCGSIIGTYLHGPLLGKNPQIADLLLSWALEHRAKRLGMDVEELSALDDADELAANAGMASRIIP